MAPIINPAVFGDGNARVFNPHELALAGCVLMRLLENGAGVWSLQNGTLAVNATALVSPQEEATMRTLIAP